MRSRHVVRAILTSHTPRGTGQPTRRIAKRLYSAKASGALRTSEKLLSQATEEATRESDKREQREADDNASRRRKKIA